MVMVFLSMLTRELITVVVIGDSDWTELGLSAYLLMFFVAAGLLAGMHTGWLGNRRVRHKIHLTYWHVKHAMEPSVFLSESDPNRENPRKMLGLAQSSTANFASIWTGFWTRKEECPPPITSEDDLQGWFEFLHRRRSEKFRIRNLWIYVRSCLTEI